MLLSSVKDKFRKAVQTTRDEIFSLNEHVIFPVVFDQKDKISVSIRQHQESIMKAQNKLDARSLVKIISQSHSSTFMPEESPIYASCSLTEQSHKCGVTLSEIYDKEITLWQQGDHVHPGQPVWRDDRILTL